MAVVASAVAVAVASVTGATAGPAVAHSASLPRYEYRFAFSRITFVDVLFVGSVVVVVFVLFWFVLEIFGAVLYVLNFAKTSGSCFVSLSLSADWAAAWGALDDTFLLVRCSFAFANSLRISTCISLGALVSIIYFRDTVSKYL